MATVEAVARDRVLRSPAVARRFPYWRYVTQLDEGVRPNHAALHGKVFAINDPFWDKYNPPWDWGCRCGKIAVNKRQLKKLGVDVSTIADVNKQGIDPAKDFAFPRDQLKALDASMLRQFKGDIKVFVEQRFKEADVQEALALAGRN